MVLSGFSRGALQAISLPLRFADFFLLCQSSTIFRNCLTETLFSSVPQYYALAGLPHRRPVVKSVLLAGFRTSLYITFYCLRAI